MCRPFLDSFTMNRRREHLRKDTWTEQRLYEGQNNDYRYISISQLESKYYKRNAHDSTNSKYSIYDDYDSSFVEDMHRLRRI